ncbi:hypothetical protein [Curtobacterium flaccumfaciens]|uniref:hypothetical protein n=1 Tax=Curtobacterium flaccumfaciens TaxID=2035 RepID=UPI003D9A2B7B
MVTGSGYWRTSVHLAAPGDCFRSAVTCPRPRDRQCLLGRREEHRITGPSERDGECEVLDGTVDAPGGEQRLASVLPHHGLASRPDALGDEEVVLAHCGAGVAEVTVAVGPQCSDTLRRGNPFETTKRSIRLAGPQQLDLLTE